MRKLQRSILKGKAYRGGGGNRMFKMLWKDLRIAQGHDFVQQKYTKPKSVFMRAVDGILNKVTPGETSRR